MGIINTIFTAMTIFYIVVIANSMLSYLTPKPFGRFWYPITCYSISFLALYRFITLIRFTTVAAGKVSKAIPKPILNFLGISIKLPKAVTSNSLYKGIKEIIEYNPKYIFNWFLICISLYLFALFMMKITGVGRFSIRHILYSGILLYATYRVVGSSVRLQDSITLIIVAILGLKSLKLAKKNKQRPIKEQKEDKEYD